MQIVKKVPREDALVYFLLFDDRWVKIGYSVDPWARARQIATSMPLKPRILLVIPGGRPMEQWLHEVFAKWRTNGEWFNLSKELLVYIHNKLTELGMSTKDHRSKRRWMKALATSKLKDRQLPDTSGCWR